MISAEVRAVRRTRVSRVLVVGLVRRAMASRKKPDPAALRTISFLTGKTPIEEAEDLAREELPDQRDDGARDLVAEGEDAAIRWLGLDAFHEGDDVRIAIAPNGTAVLMLVSTTKPLGVPYGVSTLKLSRQQWSKLRKLCRE